jgi:hypothetical protein
MRWRVELNRLYMTTARKAEPRARKTQDNPNTLGRPRASIRVGSGVVLAATICPHPTPPEDGRGEDERGA